MITLKKIDAETYDAFFKRIVKLYAEECETAGRWTNEEAPEKSRTETEKLLPDKHKTVNNYMYDIMNGADTAGYIWAGNDGGKKTEAFIYALEIFEPFRGNGFGKKGMELLEEELRKNGYTRVGLHVFEHSRTAVSLYESLGYGRVSSIMRKEL